MESNNDHNTLLPAGNISALLPIPTPITLCYVKQSDELYRKTIKHKVTFGFSDVMHVEDLTSS